APFGSRTRRGGIGCDPPALVHETGLMVHDDAPSRQRRRRIPVLRIRKPTPICGRGTAALGGVSGGDAKRMLVCHRIDNWPRKPHEIFVRLPERGIAGESAKRPLK